MSDFDDYGSNKSIVVKPGVLTAEDLEEAFARSVENQRHFSRTISYEMSKLLEKIREIEPNWNNWLTGTEIQFKAYELGIKVKK